MWLMLDADYIVARFGIVAIFPILFWTHVLFLGFHYCGKKVWETIFFEKKKATSTTSTTNTTPSSAKKK